MRKRFIPRSACEPPRKRIIPRSRNEDPWTSHNAGRDYEDQTVRPGTIRHKALALFDAAPDGLIGDELPNGWWKRVSELRRLKLVKDTGVPRIGSSGKPGLVHIITAHGRHALVWLEAGKSWSEP